MIRPIYGSITALITPFDENDDIDVVSYKNIIEHQIKSGTHGIVPVGTTGESPVLSFEEHDKVIEIAIQTAAGRVPVIAGTGANNTKEAIDITAHAQEMGADAALIVTPYYNKPGQEALYAHYKAIHDATDIPIILYNVPGRTGCDLLPETVARLSHLPRIIGIKEASGNVERFSQHRMLSGKDFILLSGDDGSTLGAYAHGATGCISVTANVAPELCAKFQNALKDGDFEKALEIQDKLYPLHQNLFLEANPVPVKFAVSKLGLCNNSIRLPLLPANENTQEKVISAMKHAELL